MDETLKKEALEFARSANVSVLATASKTKTVNARVMQIVQVDDDFTVWYSSYAKLEKVDEIKANPNVCIVMSNYHIHKDVRYHGKIQILTDQPTKDRFWKDEWKMFYPGGKTDPNYIVLKFVPNSIEFRDMNKYGMEPKKIK